MSIISVVLPTYNGLPYVKQSVESVLHQTYKEFEFLICDDASTDGTWEYLQTIKDKRVKLFRNENNRGLFPTLNFLIKQASAPFIFGLKMILCILFVCRRKLILLANIRMFRFFSHKGILLTNRVKL